MLLDFDKPIDFEVEHESNKQKKTSPKRSVQTILSEKVKVNFKSNIWQALTCVTNLFGSEVNCLEAINPNTFSETNVVAGLLAANTFLWICAIVMTVDNVHLPYPDVLKFEVCYLILKYTRNNESSFV